MSVPAEQGDRSTTFSISSLLRDQRELRDEGAVDEDEAKEPKALSTRTLKLSFIRETVAEEMATGEVAVV